MLLSKELFRIATMPPNTGVRDVPQASTLYVGWVEKWTFDRLGYALRTMLARHRAMRFGRF